MTPFDNLYYIPRLSAILVIGYYLTYCMPKKYLVWSDEFSVGVKILDDQHKRLIEAIDKLLNIIGARPNRETLDEIIFEILEYKKDHFATEEKYFQQCNYEGTEEHIAEHKKFSESLTDLQTKHKDSPEDFVFALADFLEDWLVDHLWNMDRKYIDCFNKCGLK
jgi:hemerythrin